MINGLQTILLKCIRLFLSLIIPVKKNKIILESFPDYSDNARALSDYLVINTGYQLFWSVEDAKRYTNTDRITFIEKNGGKSLIGRLIFVYHTVSSHLLFSTHASFLFANKRKQQYVCLWHGMPLKKICRLLDPGNTTYLNNAKYILCTSKYYQPIFEQCFGKTESEVLPIGIPRNDYLFQNTDVLERLGIINNKEEKLVVFLPTFRKVSLKATGDSNTDSFNNSIVDLSTQDGISELNQKLKDIKVKLIVKPHPADINQLNLFFLSNIVIIPHKTFAEKDIQLNHLLRYANALITDFSGVFIDYLNLNRPIGFVLSDLAEYERKRGFLFENPLDYLPGVQIRCNEDFIDFCKDVANDVDRSKSIRDGLMSVYNDFCDENNCQRLASFLKLEQKK